MPTKRPRSRRRSDIADAALRTLGVSNDDHTDPDHARRAIADCYRLVGSWLTEGHARDDKTRDDDRSETSDVDDELPALSPRLRETLHGLLSGASEKQIAHRLRISPHTVHVYVKTLHRRFAVSSRGELLARFVRPAALRVQEVQAAPTDRRDASPI